VSAERLRQLLGLRGVGWPAPLEHFDSVGSTSDELKRRAAAGAPAWAVVTAEQQTRGRGRSGASWVSPRGNLHLSVLLRPSNAGPQLSLVPLLAGIAVASSLREYELRAEIKWPNDVLVEDRKIAGVLAEASTLGTEVAIVLGIGIDVNADAGVPAGGVSYASTCMSRLLGRPIDPLAVAAAVLARLRDVYSRLEGEGARGILSEWRALSVPWWGELVEVSSDERTIRGRAKDVDDDGALLLEDEAGRVMTVHSGQAFKLRRAPARNPA
jgi:BirA family biotin operon repressor/biotin-[acetyl-CoA-carboxylase] ligase